MSAAATLRGRAGTARLRFPHFRYGGGQRVLRRIVTCAGSQRGDSIGPDVALDLPPSLTENDSEFRRGLDGAQSAKAGRPAIKGARTYRRNRRDENLRRTVAAIESGRAARAAASDTGRRRRLHDDREPWNRT